MRRATVFFIFMTVMLDVLALGVVIPVLPGLVQSLFGGDTAHAAQIYGLFGTIWALMHFICSPILGMLSDRFGRRPVILLSNFGLGLDYILMALAPSLNWLFIGRVISGITASSIVTANAYIADVTTPEKRASGYGMLGAAFGVGFVLGPALGGALGSVNVRLPFWVAAALSLMNAVYGIFVLPESLPKANRTPFQWKKANPLGSLRLLRGHSGLLRLSAVRFLGMVAHVVLPSVYVLYVGYRYQWDTTAVGLALAVVGVCSGIVQAGLIGPAVKRLGEGPVLGLGLIFGTVGFLVLGFAPTGFWSLVGIPFLALWGLANPAIQGIMSRAVGPDEQGQLQGANSSLTGIAELIGPGIFTGVFALFIQEDNPLGLPFRVLGAPFILAGILLGASWILARGLSKR